MRRFICGLGLLAALSVPLSLAPSCSLQNVEGPDVTCESLDCGRINACANGIIAQCSDGMTVKYHVCRSNAQDICDEDWQTPGEYKCLEFSTECEGCRPEREEGCGFFATGGAGGTSASGGGGGSTADGGSSAGGSSAGGSSAGGSSAGGSSAGGSNAGGTGGSSAGGAGGTGGTGGSGGSGGSGGA